MLSEQSSRLDVTSWILLLDILLHRALRWVVIDDKTQNAAVGARLVALDVPWLMRTINRYKYGRGMHTDTLPQGHCGTSPSFGTILALILD